MSAQRMDSADGQATSRERLSALLDGEATPSQFDEWLASHQGDPEQRRQDCEAWHLYHLIGDVMRSEDLAGGSRGDVFLQGVRQRLQHEPVIVAPSVAASSVGRARRRWRTPVATAAGVAAVAGALIVLRLGDAGVGMPSSGGTPLAQQQAVPSSVAATAVVPVAAPAAPTTAASATELRVVHGDQTLIRDARLDQYLAAHKQFGGGSALGAGPSLFLRNATHEGPGR
ncbi:sigma-E factor negative regulatory protein [Caldimonas sp.]|uniref:sigma-E factor negative regulatory protein n=1 Tax=Caldimonas sp. TaxID=2838790 RepID=UPI00391C683A